VHSSRQQKVHRPPEEGRHARVADKPLANGAGRGANRLADHAFRDQDAEEHPTPGGETGDVFPSAMLLAEDSLIDRLQRVRYCHGAGSGENQGGHDPGSGIGGRGSEELAHDESALLIQADVPAQVVVDSVIGQGAEQDDERKDGHQQRGAEKDAGVDHVQGAELPEEDLDG